LESSKKRVTTYLSNELTLKIDCAVAFINSNWVRLNEKRLDLYIKEKRIFKRVNVPREHWEGMAWAKLECSPLQILVKVAIIQMKYLKTDAEKGFKRTMFELESVDPNGKINFDNY
jgi:hypothetical protein